MNIFLLEDDSSLQRGIQLKLSKEGHHVICSETAASAVKSIDQPMDMAILDINLPDGNGMEICKILREKKSISLHILILTSNDSETDIVMGYDMGADDYLTKPFSLSVLLSKVNAVQRRISIQSTPFLFDSAKQTVEIRGRTVLLTRNEWRLLHILWRNRGQILSKDKLLESLWDIDGDFVDENTLAVNIRRLREKVEENPSAPTIIENVRGVGYRLNQI